MLCNLLLVPVWLVVFVLSFAGVGLADHILRPYHLEGLVPSAAVTLAGSVIITVLLGVFIIRRGIKRGWNSPKGLRWGWRIAAGLGIAMVAGGILFVRQTRQSTADKVVLGTARQLSAVADQYFLDNGVSTVSYDSLVGATNYVKAVFVSHQEIYPTAYTQGVTITITGVDGVRTVTYAP